VLSGLLFVPEFLIFETCSSASRNQIYSENLTELKKHLADVLVIAEKCKYVKNAYLVCAKICKSLRNLSVKNKFYLFCAVFVVLTGSTICKMS